MIDYPALFEHLADPYLILDDHVEAIGANAAWRELFGAEVHVVGAASNRDIDAQQQVVQQRDQTIKAVVVGMRTSQVRQSGVFQLDVAAVVGQGGDRQRYWRLHASLLPATSDTASLIALRFEDVTTHALADEAARREKARLRSHARLRQILAQETDDQPSDDPRPHLAHTLALAGLGVWEIDLASGAVDCSERCLRDLGIAQRTDLTHEQLLGGLPAQVAATLSTMNDGRPFEFEQGVRLAEGPRWVLVRGAGRLRDDGTLHAVAGITFDITSRKERELELGARADAERSARERSEALTRTMDQFIAGVSHELRSPLNAIVSWAELLQIVADPAHLARAGEAIRRNGRQLSHMVDDLLDSGAIATGKLSVNLQPVDLGALAAIVAEDMRKAAEQKGLALHAANISPCVVIADESRIKQVVWNLLTNAVKFTDTGSVEISVTVEDGLARLRVRDSGRGIDAEALSLVFDRFQQIAPESSGRVGGLGLGLWLARHIVGLHDGSIEATSEGPGCGSTFTVTLPLAS